VHACGRRNPTPCGGLVAVSALQRVVFGLFSGNSGHPCGRHMALGFSNDGLPPAEPPGLFVRVSRAKKGHALRTRQVITYLTQECVE
jgi:hypothetical protein